MILNLYTDASYLSVRQDRIRTGGCFLGNIPNVGEDIEVNDNIHSTCAIFKSVAVSAAKSKLAAFFSIPKKRESSATA